MHDLIIMVRQLMLHLFRRNNMVDPNSLGLDENLMPVNSPVTKPTGFQSGIKTDSNNYDFPIGSIDFTNQNYTSRAYAAVVTLSGTGGTFKDLQLAINYVNSIGGGTIFIRNGTYVLKAIIVMYSNIHLVGEDSVNTIIDCNAADNHFAISGISNVSIENLTIQNGQSTNTVGTVYVTNSSKIKLSGINYKNNATGGDPAACITNYIDNTGGAVDQLLISFCTSSNDSVFVYLKGNSRNCWFENNNISSPVTFVFDADTTAGGSGHFTDNVITDCPAGAIYGKFTFSSFIGNKILFTSSVGTDYIVDFTSGAGNSEFVGNHISNGGTGGIRLTNCGNMTIANNGVGAGTGDALNINTATTNLSNITGNYLVVATSGLGINAANATKLVITGNAMTSTGSGKDGIVLVSVTESIITGNWIQSGGAGTAYGVNLDANSNNNAVVGNRIRFNTAATHDAGSGNVIASNA